MRHTMTALLIVSVVLAAVGCRRVQKAGGSAAAQPGSAERTGATAEDLQWERVIAGTDPDGDRAAEARGWLDPAQTKNVLWKGDKQQVRAMVEELYTSGAAKVHAVYSPADRTIQVNVCASFIITLPNEPAARGKVFAAFNKIDRRIWGPDHDKINDTGQKYLHLSLDA